MPKRLLIIKAAADVCLSEIAHLQVITEMFDISHCTMTLTDMSEFIEQLCTGDKYDFVYLGAHANTEFFGESDGSVAIGWDELAV